MQDSVKMSKPELILCCYFAVFISYFVNFSLQIPRKLYFTIFQILVLKIRPEFTQCLCRYEITRNRSCNLGTRRLKTYKFIRS